MWHPWIEIPKDNPALWFPLLKEITCNKGCGTECSRMRIFATTFSLLIKLITNFWHPLYWLSYVICAPSFEQAPLPLVNNSISFYKGIPRTPCSVLTAVIPGSRSRFFLTGILHCACAHTPY